MMTVTDDRVLFTAGGDNGDSTLSIDYELIADIEARSGPEKSDGSGKVTVSLNTKDTSITFPFKTAGTVNLADVHSDREEVQEAVDYISSQAAADVERTEKEKSSIRSARRRISDEESGNYVTPERVNK